MGKRRAVRRFIDPKRDICLKFVNKSEDEEEEEEEASIAVPPKKFEASQQKEKKVSFKLKCDPPDTPDLTQYGVYFNDGYDYMKHLKERDAFNWAGGAKELSLAPKPHPQQRKKDLREEKKLKKQTYGEPTEESSVYYVPPVANDDDDDGDDKADELFSDTEFVDELPDNLIDILDGAVPAGELCSDFNYDENEDMKDEASNINFMMEGEVDYSKMPPLEQLDLDSDDSRSYASTDCMDVSGDEEENESPLQLDDDNFPSLEASKSIIVKAAPPTKSARIPQSHKTMVMSLKDFHQVSSTDIDHFLNDVPSNIPQTGKPVQVSLKKFKQAIQGDVDSFFDAVGKTSDDEEGGYQDPEVDRPWSGLPSSRTAAKVTEKVDMMNEHFNAMMAREFKRSDVCGDGLEEVEGALDEDAPQFRAAAAADRSGAALPLEGRLYLAGPRALRETSEEKELRNRALNFCKNWRETKEELVEVAIPDPRAMMYNATNLPVVRNKNFPALIKPDLPSYFNPKKKKGLSVKDIKAHDREMNAPKSNAEEDAQTYKTMLTELSYRPPGESSVDRRERKTAVRELRRGRREEKKQNQIAHKEMVLHTAKMLMHARHYRNTTVV